MKIRTSFVTNSSSSSFVVFGVEASALNRPELLTTSSWSGDEMPTDELRRMLNGTDLEVDGQYYMKIGIPMYTYFRKFGDIKVSEMKGIAANQINQALGTSFTEADIDYFEEGWYEG